LTDWRESHANASSPDGASSSSDKTAMMTGIAGGEGYDWYYASQAARDAGTRTPIVDGLTGKHWVFRAKDLKGWWQNQHYPRLAGVESPTPTAWTARAKPIWFTELGCPAVDKGANQPNVFPDAKSSAASLPWYSDGGRDDLVQNRFLAAHIDFWGTTANNPVSPGYGKAMVDMGRCSLWAWDARPYPAFPLKGDVWGDGNNWLTGHWLNGRLSGVPLDGLISAILDEHGISGFDCSAADGFVSGFVLSGQTTAREALDQLLGVYRIDVSEQGGRLTFRSRDRALPAAVAISDFAFGKNDHLKTETRGEQAGVAGELTLMFRDELRDHQQVTVRSLVRNGDVTVGNVEVPASLDPGLAEAQLRQLHREMVSKRTSVAFQTGWREAALTPGDVVTPFGGSSDAYRVRKVTDGMVREIEADLVFAGGRSATRSTLPGMAAGAAGVAGQPWSVFLDLPDLTNGAGAGAGLRVAAWAKPWMPMVAYSSPTTSGYTLRANLGEVAIAGSLVGPLGAGGIGLWDRVQNLDVQLFSGSMASAADILVLGGANAAAVRSANGQWEIIQFAKAAEISAGVWRLSRLLRGQLGTDDAARAGAAAGAEFVLLDSGVVSAGLNASEAGLVLNWKTGPAGKDFTDRYFASSTAGPAQRATFSFSPVHLSAKRQSDGSRRIDWIRRSARDSDGWDAADIPPPEGAEAYQVRVLNALGQAKRTVTVSTPSWSYAAAAILADFGAGPAAVTVEVAQIGANGLAGIPATAVFAI
jgi:hypothetical protein